MSRLLTLLVAACFLVAGVVASAPEAEARTRSSASKKTSKKSASKKTSKKSASKKKSKKSASKKKSKKSKKKSRKTASKKSKKRSARAAKANRINMPRQWEWPPSAEMQREGETCLARLDELGVSYERAEAIDKVVTPIVVSSMELGGVTLESIWRKGPFVMDCFLAQSLAERGGPALRALGVKKLRFSSIYSYRNISGKSILSRHALGLAMDIWEFVTDDDVVHIVKDDYPKGDAVLQAVELSINATGAYRMLLTPGNDPDAHDDHFHFEARTPSERMETPPPVTKETGADAPATTKTSTQP